MSEEIILYGLYNGENISLYYDADTNRKDDIEVCYGSYCGEIRSDNLPGIIEHEVMELRIKAKVIGKEAGI